MDKTAMNVIRRHSFVVISPPGREWAYQEVLRTNEQQYENRRLYQLIVQGFNGIQIPGIVRRSEKLSEELIAVGFASPYRLDGNRLRVGSYAKISDVETIASPYDVLEMSFAPSNACLSVLLAVRDKAKELGVEIGVLGSAGLEVFTGLPYIHAKSDIDLLIKPTVPALIIEAYRNFAEIACRYNTAIDMEVELSNGYGIKAGELVMNTDMILGKGLADVVLLNRSAVLAMLNNIG